MPALDRGRLEDLLAQMRDEPADIADFEDPCWPLCLEDREVAREQTIRPRSEVDQCSSRGRFEEQCWPGETARA